MAITVSPRSQYREEPRRTGDVETRVVDRASHQCIAPVSRRAHPVYADSVERLSRWKQLPGLSYRRRLVTTCTSMPRAVSATARSVSIWLVAE